jgi:hypothetical protein
MDSYRAEKKAAMKIALPDENAEIEPVPTSGGGRKPEPELDKLSDILKNFNDHFGNISWTDADRVRQLIQRTFRQEFLQIKPIKTPDRIQTGRMPELNTTKPSFA